MRAVGEGVFVLLTGLFGIWGASLVPAPDEGDTWAGVAPMSVSCFMALCGALLVVLNLRAFRLAPFMPSRGALEVCGLAALAFAYYKAMILFGYVLPTFFAAPLALAAFGVRNKIGLLVAAFLCPLLFHLAFFVGLGVFPPRGEMFDLLETLKS